MTLLSQLTPRPDAPNRIEENFISLNQKMRGCPRILWILSSVHLGYSCQFLELVHALTVMSFLARLSIFCSDFGLSRGRNSASWGLDSRRLTSLTHPNGKCPQLSLQISLMNYSIIKLNTWLKTMFPWETWEFHLLSGYMLCSVLREKALTQNFWKGSKTDTET